MKRRRPDLFSLRSWELHEERVLEVFECALARLGALPSLPEREDDLNRLLLRLFRSENCRLIKLQRGTRSPVMYEASNQPAVDDITRAARESKRPDFQCGWVDCAGRGRPLLRHRVQTPRPPNVPGLDSERELHHERGSPVRSPRLGVRAGRRGRLDDRVFANDGDSRHPERGEQVRAKGEARAHSVQAQKAWRGPDPPGAITSAQFPRKPVHAPPPLARRPASVSGTAAGGYRPRCAGRLIASTHGPHRLADAIRMGRA